MSARIQILLLFALVLFAAPVEAVDVSVVPLWDGETSSTPDGLLVNRFGGQPVHGGGNLVVSHASSQVHSGDGAFRVSTSSPINPGGFSFFLTALSPGASYGPGRDLSNFDEARFWLNNQTGASFNLKFEVKDYRDSSAHTAWRNQTISATAGWQEYTMPLDLTQPGWQVTGSPDIERARFFGFVTEANQGQSINGSYYLDDLTLSEAGGPLDTQTASVTQLAGRLAQRQFNGLWGSRNRGNGLIPLLSTTNSAGALNNTAAMVKMLPGAVGRGWVSQADADSYVQTVVSTLDTAMNNFSTYLPPRYMNMATLAPTIAEESPIDAALMALALHQYKRLATTPAPLTADIDALQNRFNFAAFSDTTAPTRGWKLAYNTDTNSFTNGTYDGYSGEPWLMSLAAHLSDTFHVDIETQYHSAIFRQPAFLTNAGDAHLVHSSSQFRAPFLQWLMPLFVDVGERGVDTYSARNLASNPLENAEAYQREVHAWFAQQGRADLLQPDAGDDGSGTSYEQYSAYNDFGRSDLLMPWSVAFSLMGDAAPGDVALRNMLEAALHGPLGLSDSSRWTTGTDQPYQVTARHDLWNTSLSTMALAEFLYTDNGGFSALPEVASALDQVFFLTWDGQGDGLWSTNQWNGGQAPPSMQHDAQILANLVTLDQIGAAHRTRVTSGRLHIAGSLQSSIDVRADGALSGSGTIVGDVQLSGTFALDNSADQLDIEGAIELVAGSQLAITATFDLTRGTLATVDLLTATDGVAGEFDNVAGVGIDSHLGEGFFLEDITYDTNVISVDILAALLGDANGDRVVDGQDFLVWNTHKFMSGTSWTQGDFNSDGITDGQDFLLWNTFKFTSYDGSAVPEPMFPLSAFFWLAWLFRRSSTMVDYVKTTTTW